MKKALKILNQSRFICLNVIGTYQEDICSNGNEMLVMISNLFSLVSIENVAKPQQNLRIFHNHSFLFTVFGIFQCKTEFLGGHF